MKYNNLVKSTIVAGIIAMAACPLRAIPPSYESLIDYVTQGSSYDPSKDYQALFMAAGPTGMIYQVAVSYSPETGFDIQMTLVDIGGNDHDMQ